MFSSAIRAEGLGKRYRLRSRNAYRTLRDALMSGFGEKERASDAERTLWALRDVSFDIRAGEAVGVIGRNGAGKTSLLRVLSRITRPTAGTVSLRGRVASLLEVGTAFHPELSGLENVAFAGAVLGMSRSDIALRLDEIVEFSGVGQFIDVPLKRYSTGMQMRLAFAVAAHLEPEVMLVDEALAVGDLEFQRRCLQRIEEVARSGRTVMLVTHQTQHLSRICARCIWLDEGRVRLDAGTDDVLAAYQVAADERASAPPASLDTGGAAVRFVSWELVDVGPHGRHTLHSDGPVRLEMLVDIAQPIERGEYGVTLYDGERRSVCALSAELNGMAPGRYRIRHDIASLPLHAGTYRLQAGLFDGEEWTVWWMTPDLHLEVPDRAGGRRGAERSVLNVDGAVTVTPIT